MWKAAEKDKLHSLLNLVSDEHLERNLRALDRSFGDQLKMLAAYAFQHVNREYPVEKLLTALQGKSFAVLSSSPMDVARRHACVGLLNGRVLLHMERVGMSFARFVRALRMGLGNRHDDPKVEEALGLFRGKFRKSSMDKMLEISKRLREIFGRETEILDSFDLHAALEGDSGADGEGITDAEVQSSVEDVLQGKSKRKPDRDSKFGRGLNLGPEEEFDLINEVKAMPHDRDRHAALADRVKRPAEVLKRFLKYLGIGLQPVKQRMTGKTLDRSRLRAVVLRGDPRMLIAREQKTKTDLFIGVVIDCSGSMARSDNIEKAKLFGTLIAEAGKGYPGVDVRLFGFTDAVIYDCGTANRCAVHELEAGGGNNDAAGLWHAAQAALKSKRRAKLLVMISDGSPTECTVTALRGLVVRLSKRMKMCCARWPCAALDHVCFENYILLEDDNLESSVRKFGTTMAKLVQRAMRG